MKKSKSLKKEGKTLPLNTPGAKFWVKVSTSADFEIRSTTLPTTISMGIREVYFKVKVKKIGEELWGIPTHCKKTGMPMSEWKNLIGKFDKKIKFKWEKPKHGGDRRSKKIRKETAK